MKRFLLLLSILLAMGIHVAAPVKADTCDLVYDFAEGQQGWDVLAWGTVTGDDGYGGGTWTGDSFETEHIPDYSTVLIYLDFDPAILIDSVDFTVVYNYSATPTGKIAHTRLQNPADWETTVGLDSHNALDNTGTQTFTGNPHNVTTARVWIDLRILDFVYRSVEITSVTIHVGDCTPTGSLIRPFSMDDENATFGVYDNTDLALYTGTIGLLITQSSPDIVYGLSGPSDAYVMAAGDGTIEDIQPFDALDGCSLYSWFLPDRCFVALTAHDPLRLIVPYIASLVDAYKVTLKLDSGETLVYWLTKANLYVNRGIHISGGCILGLAMPLQPVAGFFNILTGLNVGIGFISLEEFAIDEHYGLVFIGKLDTEDENPESAFLPLVSELGEYANPEEACNIDPRFSGCMVNDPELRDSSQWQTDGSVQWFPTPGVELDPGGTVYQQLNLAPDTAYHMIISLFPSPTILAGKPAEVTLYLGDQHQTFTISPGGTGQYEMTVTPAPDIAGQFYTVRVANTGQAWFIVSGICVGEEGRQIVPSDCLVDNSGFDYDLSNWTASSGVEWSFGKAWVPSEDTLTQTITLPPGDYDASIELFVWTEPGWDGTGSISLDVTWPDEMTPDTIATNPTWNLPGNLGFPAYPQVIHSTFTVGSDTTGDFILSPGTSANEDILGLKIDKVCITEVGSEGGFNANCDVVTTPADDSFGAWISYHWQQLNRFFQCDLMVFLNKLLGILQNFFKTVMWVMRWFMASVQNAAEWAGRYLFPWMNGHFRNMATGQVTTITGGGDCHDIFCVLYGLIDGLSRIIQGLIAPIVEVIHFIISLLVNALNLLISLFSGVVTVALAVIGKLFGVIQSGIDLLGALLTAFNTAAPTAIPGLPTCATDPDSSLLCIGVWVMDNTIFTGRWGILFTLILAILSIHLILWVIGEFRNSIISTGGES